MPVEPGSRLLHYTLTEKIGEGGMGAVWRATDTSLNRDVAIKLLPQIFADSPERLARFEREAKLLASLNHPNIAAVYGLHQEGGEKFLAMELVEGEDLSKRLQRGPLPLDQALDIAAQMAAGIEAAHEKGVVHRDLKPANVIVMGDSPTGLSPHSVKLLDFGLAKALENDPASGDPSLSPTMTSAGTVAGMILGTAAYMSPEQARGKPIDRRTDLWSFGCVLYECLTGKSLFGGETISDSLAAILRKEPDWSALPDDTPPMVRLLLRRCLARDPAKRIRDAGDARLELEQAIEDPSVEALGLTAAGAAAPAETAATRSRLPWVLTAVAAIVAIFFALRPGGPTPDSVTRRLTIPVENSLEFGDAGRQAQPSLSPDGNSVVFGQLGEDGVSRLQLQPLDSFETRELAGTENATGVFWSPDSKHIGFYLDGRLKRMELASGRIQPIGGEAAQFPRGASWGTGGQVIFAPNSNTGIWIVDAAGGTPRQITTPDPDIVDGSHRWPCFLPDGEHFLFLLWTNDFTALEQYGGVYLGSISGDTEPVRLVPDTSSMAYAPPGYLLVMQETNLMAVPFDADKRRVHGEAAVVASEVMYSTNSGNAAFSVSAEGSLVYVRGSAEIPPATFAWYDREGNESPTPLEPTPFMGELHLSQDARRAVALLPDTTGDGAIFVLDLVRGVPSRLTPPAPFSYRDPVMSADGEHVLYVSPESGTWDIYLRKADGSGGEQTFFQTNMDKRLFDWSRDRRWVLHWPVGVVGDDLHIYDAETRESEMVVEGGGLFIDGRFSPDGRHIAYVVDDSGRPEVFIQTIDGGARGQVSTSGGTAVHWRDDGREVLYTDPERRLMAVSVEFGENGMTLGTPRELFALDPEIVSIDASGDHQRFLGALVDQVAGEPLHVVLGWDKDL